MRDFCKKQSPDKSGSYVGDTVFTKILNAPG